MDANIWLREMFRQELDLRPPSLARINERSIIIYDGGSPVAHAIRTNRWKGSEINSLVVDPTHRGKGISHKLVEKCVSANPNIDNTAPGSDGPEKKCFKHKGKLVPWENYYYLDGIIIIT